MILLQNEDPGTVRIIKSGVVRVYDITAEGEERTVSFDVETEIIPIGWVLGKLEKAQYFYQALTDVEVYTLKRQDFLHYIKFHPKIAYEFYANLANRHMALQHRIYALEQTTAASKIAYTLSYLVGRFGEKNSANVSQLTVPLTQQELANFIGLTRETTSTELKKLERRGILRTKDKLFHINTPKLRKLIDEL